MAGELEKYEELANDLNISKEECKRYHKFYDDIILPRIKKKILPALVSVVEDLIDEKIKGKDIKESSEDTPEKNAADKAARWYKILLSDEKPIFGPDKKEYKIHTWSCSQGAVIKYDPENSEEEIHALLAQQLGNLLIENRVIFDSNTEAHEKLFAHFALNTL